MHRYRAGMMGLALVFSVSLVAGTMIGLGSRTGSDSARADAFWSAVHVEAIEAPDPTSLDELVRNSDAAIIGKVALVAPGREWVAATNLKEGAKDLASEAVARFASVTVEIEESLSGNDLGSSVVLEVFLPTSDSLKALSAELPRGRAMFFLHKKLDPGLDGVYRLLGESASFYLDVDGKPDAPVTDGSELSAELQATYSFEGLAARVRALGSAQ